MLSPKAREIFSELLDVNYDMKDNYNAKNIKRYMELEQQLIEEMGQEEYKAFVNLGRRMFAPSN
jgi:hypothetical protein